MSRIRSIKPEFWSSEQIMECSPNARLLFIGIWNFCDDYGCFVASARQLKALIFASDDITSENVRRMLVELSTNGLIKFYEVSSKEYFFVTGWAHQKIDRRGAAKYPEPPIVEDSSNVRRPFGDRKGCREGVKDPSQVVESGEVSLTRAHAHEHTGTHEGDDVWRHPDDRGLPQ